jgi:tRNA pseudouridine32 synthase/23S rRNA pseudouridine746 synthase
MQPFFWLLLCFGGTVQSFVVDGVGRRHQTVQTQVQAAPAILYESDRILAICKPTGISHHDDGEEDSGIMSLIRKCQASGDIDYQGRIYGVHRLDRVTSGILLFAKDSTTAGILSNKFRDGQITKYYCGISAKKPAKKKQGWIQGNMVKGRRKSWLLTRDSEGESDNYAKTRFFTSGLSALANQLVDTEIQPKTLVLFRPHTGKTHQLRVAAKSVGLPLLGDPVYKDGSADDKEAPRTYLHACALHLELDDQEVTIWSPPPFGGLWDSPGSAQFDQCFREVVDKHCDCGAITEKLE